MKLEERIKAEGVFKNDADVLIATEAAGEGINLQFCHLMVNYDISLNPNPLWRAAHVDAFTTDSAEGSVCV